MLVFKTLRSGPQMHKVKCCLCLEIEIVKRWLSAHLELDLVVDTSLVVRNLILWSVHMMREAI